MAGIQKLRDLEHNVIVHPQTNGRLKDTQSAGTIDEKVTALQDLMRNPDVDVVMTVSGGNFALHLLPHIDFQTFTKPLIGFSDATSLLNASYAATNRVNYHGPMATTFSPKHFNSTENYDQMLAVLDGTATTLPMTGAQTTTPGIANGRLIGGNLEAFRALVGTPYMPNLDGAIVFLEDIGLELNHFDRTIVSLKLAGVFDRAAGVIFGQFTNMLDTGRPFGFTLDEIVSMHLQDLNKPVVINAPFGHIGVLTTFPIGAMATLDARQGQPTLTLEK